jgi:agmatine deiminase
MRMPAEWAPHERTIVCWPARESMWKQHFAAAKAEHAAVINAIAAFEPVTLAVDPSQEAEARAAVRGDVDIVAIPLDDSWARDSGPIFVTGDGSRAGVHFGFNAWGEKFAPYDKDAAFGARVLEHLGVERVDAGDLILEGGSIAVDGEGTLITTEQCLLEDDDTDGHVDNICAWIEPGRVLLQTVADENDPNFGLCRENAERLSAAGIDVVELDVLPRLAGEDPPVVVPYVNFYIANGALIVPVTGAETDPDALALLERLYPGREAVPVPGTTLAIGGGGVHCITQQVPRA